MGKYNEIQEELLRTDQATFQQVCNAYLSYSFPGYLHSVGSVPGKQKTRRGKPDAYIYTKNGKYILSEATTQDPGNKSGFDKKLTADLNDLMNTKHHNMDKSDVESIVLCVNTNTLALSLNNKLVRVAKKNGFHLLVIGHDSIIPFLMSAGASVTKDLFGISADTGQIIDKRRFIDLYAKKKFATTLENELIGREDELESLCRALEHNACLMIKGAPGVGKTKLTMEVVEQFVSQFPAYIVYYIYQTAGSIIPDLSSYIDPSKKYIFVVDDANRQMDNLLPVMASQTNAKDGAIKIVMTVRDYAKEAIHSVFRETDIFEFAVDRLSAEKVYQILSSEDPDLGMQIKDRIYTVSGGNARLALMALKVYRERGINALSDAAEIYEGYFKSVEDDKPILGENETLKILCLISFFNTIDFTDQSEMLNIKSSGIKIEVFISKVLELQYLELVDVYGNSTVKINEQTLSTYFFYIAVFKKQIVPFSFLINKYFERYKNRMGDSFEGACRAFGTRKVFDIVKSDLQSYWMSCKDDDKKALDFIDIFGKYFPDYTLSRFYSLTQNLPQQGDISFSFLIERKFHPTASAERDNNLSCLPLLFYSKDKHIISTAFELSLEYVRKRINSFKPLLSTFFECFSPELADYENGLVRQHLIFDLLVNKLDGELNKFILYYLFERIALANYYPREAYQLNGKETKLIDGLESLRSKYWSFLIENFWNNKEISHSIIDEYLRTIGNFGIVLNHFDLQFFLKIFSGLFSVKSFDDCFYVHEYCRKVKRLKSENESIEFYRSKYKCKPYEIYEILTWDDELHSKLFLKYQDLVKVEAYKVNEILEKLRIHDEVEFWSFYDHAIKITGSRIKGRKNIGYGCDILLADLIKNSPETGINLLRAYLKDGNKLFILPLRITDSIFNAEAPCHLMYYDLLKRSTAYGADEWKYQFLIRLPENFVTAQMADEVIMFFSTCSSPINFFPEHFDKFQKIKNSLCFDILRILCQRRIDSPEFEYKLQYDFFKKFPLFIDEDLGLSKVVYIQQDDIDRHFDFDCDGFALMYNIDNNFLVEYLQAGDGEYRPIFINNSRQFFKLWKIPGIETGIYNVLVYFLEHSNWHRNEYIANTFFVNLDEAAILSTLNILKQIVSDFPTNFDAINMSVYIARNCIGKFYELLIQHYLKINPEFELFKKVEWNNNHFSSSGNAIWSDFRITELEKVKAAIRELNETLKYYSHTLFLDKKIEIEERRGEQERKEIYRGFR